MLRGQCELRDVRGPSIGSAYTRMMNIDPTKGSLYGMLRAALDKSARGAPSA